MRISVTVIFGLIVVILICIFISGCTTNNLTNPNSSSDTNNCTVPYFSGYSNTSISDIQIFPQDHIWNIPIDTLPVHKRSSDYVNTIGCSSWLNYYLSDGIPYNVIDSSQPKQKITSFKYDAYSDHVMYPIPCYPLIEQGGTDRHSIIIDRDSLLLYELGALVQNPDGSWSAGAGAVFNLSDYQLRPGGWISTDAAGLAIFPGLLRYEEVSTGEIKHALRFSVPAMGNSWVWPARTTSSETTDPKYPPAGQRFRLKASFNTSDYPPQAKTILEALKKYGMMVADNGGRWTISGVPDDRWDYHDLETLYQVKGSDFEAVEITSLMINENSGKARIPPTVSPTPYLMEDQVIQ